MSLKNPKTLRKCQENLGPQMTEQQFLKKADLVTFTEEILNWKLLFCQLEKALTLHNVIMLIKSVFNMSPNDHYYNVFLKKIFVSFSRKFIVIITMHKFF